MQSEGLAVKEKLQEYALIAEIISAICIVLSLIFVGLEIDQNTKQSRLNSSIDIKKEFNSVERNTLQNPELIDVFSKLSTGEELTQKEALYFSLFSNDIFNIGAIAFEQFQNGMFDGDDLLLTMNRVKGWMRFEVAQSQWERVKNDRFHAEYINYVEEFTFSE